ncbi:putative fermentation associated protein (Csf1) [Aspergillus melleus]|uniref:putative fermentation associated protein (Csf1) n=1 Tax=Aspergillus melleus TaxID=138277 RepID=UPI001E8DAF02|nr:Macrophage colony-stimulating factor 1 receptor [Aspergillus melleus]KAH8427406.1 Macrophage colony-stimulating factor 1 receptor [Aspergillus melleus]
MMADTSLITLTLTPDPSFNWYFLLEIIVSCILVLFFLLYFNRLFATLLSYGIRAYTWHYYRAYVDIHALQVSLLGGRIFFKGIRYHGVNETIFVHGGFITWCYWKRSVRKTDLSGLEADEKRENGRTPEDDRASGVGDSGIKEQGGQCRPDTLPCRITAKFYGLEWFIYNRTPAYDSILAGFTENSASYTKPQYPASNAVDPELKAHSERSPDASRSEFDRTSSTDNVPGRSRTGRDTIDTQHVGGAEQEMEESLNVLLRLLPLRLECDKGAIVMGNENTRSVLTTTFDGATGLIEACDAGPLDLYRQAFTFQISHPVIQMRPNPDFKQNQFATAKGISSTEEDKSGVKRKRDTIFNYQFQKRRVWHSIRDLIPYFQTSVESFHVTEKPTDNGPRHQTDGSSDVRWVGLSRYLDEASQDDHSEWSSIEYGRFSTILDTPSMTVTYFWDIPGCVRPRSAQAPASGKISQDLNGAPPPEWGIDVKLEGGTINYGPWADRERVGLQNVFFPNAYRSSQPAEPLAPGDLRKNSVFKFRVEISDELTLRVPTREPSKDWQWKGRADAIKGASKLKKQQRRRQPRAADGDKGNIGPDIRPFGWFSLRVAGDSTINYSMDMVASESGFSSQLDLDLRDSRMSSSVNHALLWQCPKQLVNCDLSVPLIWNTLRTWIFDVENVDMELFLLRDHIFLLTDLIGDWGSGPPADYYTFVPFIYKLSLSFVDLKLFVNVNDLNIISDPSDLDDNRLLVIKGKKLTSDVMIPLNKYRNEQNAVDFSVKLHDAGIDFCSPLWDTLHTFLQDKSAATLEGLSIDGTYNYYLSTSSELTDTLFLNIDGRSPKLYLFGFLIRCFMTVKENYFGEDMHFKTLEEFQELAYSKEQPESHSGINPNRKSNDLDVIVHVTVDNPCALLPENVYDHMNCLRLTAPSLEIDLRFTNYYMDLLFSIAPLKVGLESQVINQPSTVSDTQLFIDGVSVHGHRLFGLPPAEPTYVCNWDFGVGQIVGECSAEFLACLGAALKSFDFSFDNEENALPPLFPLILHDVTFLRAKFDSIHLSVLLDQAAFLLSSGTVTIQFNDWANERFSKRMSLLVPDLSISALDYNFVGRFGSLLSTEVSPLAIFKTTIKLRMAQRKNNIFEERKLQQEHIRSHDERTQRTPWLLFDWDDMDPESMHAKSDKYPIPTIPIPTMPEPLLRSSGRLASSLDKQFAGNRNPLSSKSFLVSLDSSSIRSGRRGASSVNRAASGASRSQQDHIQTLGTDGQKSLSLEERKKYAKESSANAPNTNPWVMPNFTLHKVKLDMSHLPHGPISSNDAPRDSSEVTRFDPQFSPFEDDETTHTNFALELPSGVKGYCTPDFLFMVATLIGRLQPRHPIEIIDSLQKDVISDIVGSEKSLKHPKKSTGFAIRAPFILVNLVNTYEPPAHSEDGFRDEYSLAIMHLNTGLRTRVDRHKDDLLAGISKSSTVHAAAESFSISVQGNKSHAYQEKAELSCVLGDMNFWLVTKPTMRSHFQARALDTVTFTKSVEHLAFLVRRTTTMLDSVASSFQHSSSLDSKRLRLLIYYLTQAAADIPDPAFLTRISYVLRVAPTHVRQHDSWKIISRIRNVYNRLPSDKQQELASKCLDQDLSLPQDARTIVLNSFDQWRAWDLAHVEKSYVMQRVWDSFAPTKSKASPTPLLFSSTVKMFRFSIDPGPKESDFIIEDMSTAVTVSPQQYMNSKNEERYKSLNVIQNYSSSISLRLRWEILELVESVMNTMANVQLESTAPGEIHDSGDEAEGRDDLQVVFGTDLGSITLDGINIKLACISQGLKGSVVDGADGMAVLFSSQAGFSELSNLTKVLMSWKIGSPHVYLSRASEETENEITNEWKVAGSCKKLLYVMEEDLINLAHTADRLIEDEVRYIHRLATNLDLPARKLSETPAAAKTTHNMFHIAMFLDDYRLSFCVLPSLTYVISGDVARTSIIQTMESKIEVDFDLKKNLHTFMSGEKGGRRPLSVLEIPPINGRVVANLSSNRTDIEVDVTIELIQLEASAVRSLLGALGTPEFSHLMSDLKQNVETLQLHLNDALDLNKSPPQQRKPSNAHALLYKARMTMAGTKIHATAPAVNGKNYTADMDFSFGMVRMRLDNGFDDGVEMEYPEFHIDTSNISFDLRRQEAFKSRSYCGFTVDAKLEATSIRRDNGDLRRVYHFSSKQFNVELFSETAELVVDMAVHLQERIKTLDLTHEVKRLKKLRRRGYPEPKKKALEIPDIQVNEDSKSEDFFNAMYSLDFNNIQIAWNMSTVPVPSSVRRPDDLVFSIKSVDLSNKKANAAKLRIEDMQLQLVPYSASRQKRSLNSALLPELVFNVAYSSAGDEVRLAFQAAGKSLDIRLTSDFILPASMIRDSIAATSRVVREANSTFVPKQTEDNPKQDSLFGNKRFQSVLVDVDFAGAIVSLQGTHTDDPQTMLTATLKKGTLSEAKYGQYIQGDTTPTATLRAPGVALKVQFEDNQQDSALNAELKVDASTNVLYPSLVPLVKQMTETVKEVMGDQGGRPRRPSAAVMLQPQKLMQETQLEKQDTDSILGRCKLNVGLMICKQEFSLSCQPIARVAATAKFDSAYVTVNTVQSEEYGRFFALQVAFNSLGASVKHVYSNESTASFEVNSMVMSVMNSKHLGSAKGISAVLRISPMQVILNAKQVQDLLLFREIWVPSMEDSDASPSFPPQSQENQAYIVQRYQQVASAPAFPWNTTISIEKLEIQLDLGSSLGKAQFAINDLWLSTKKSSDREQTLCVGFDTAGIESKGRMSGLIELQTLKLQTSIQWPDDSLKIKTPLIQASVSFHRFQVKVSFDYQPFLIADIAMFDFLMYNVRTESDAPSERLFSTLEGKQVQVFCTSLTASQTIALYHAWQRLIQDKQAAYEASLREVERYLRRRSTAFTGKTEAPSKDLDSPVDDKTEKAPISLHTGIVVTIKSVNIGVFPSSFFDNHVLKLEAHDAQARFDVSLDQGKIHSALGLTLGQLRVALSGIVRPNSMGMEELLVGEIANRVVSSSGGTILKVPRLVATMETWQEPGIPQIEYIFRSTFEGKVDVGWNYSRISFIRDMWETHSRALASRLGKPLPPSAVRITGGLGGEGGGDKSDQQEKITAVVNVPQSKNTYIALEPPVIETPQLRDMGEATPPLEWIGLQRDKLPNITHQIIIVTLLEVAKEVEDAYAKILGSS